MSERWQTDQLGRHCYIKARIGWRGLAASEYTDSGPFLVAGKHIEGGRVDWDASDHISEFRYNESLEIALAEGDVILSKDGTIGRVARIDSLPGKATINGTMMLVRPMRTIDHRFLYHVLNGVGFKKLIDDKVSGSSIPHIFQRDMVTLPVSFPPLAQQGKLAEVLDTLDTAIHETEAIIAKLKAVKQGLLHDLLTRGIDANGELRPPQTEAPHLYKQSPLGWIPKEWRVATLAALLSEPPRNGVYKPPHLIGRGTLLVGQTAFTEDGSVQFEMARRAQVGNMDLSTFGLRAGDLLVSRVFATLEGVGQPVVVPELPEAAVYESNMMRLRAKAGVVTSTVLFNLLKQPACRAALRSRAFLSNQASINRQGICAIELSLPPWAEQLAADARIQTLSDRLKREAETLSKQRAAKSGLMDDLLTGRVRVTPLLDGAAP